MSRCKTKKPRPLEELIWEIQNANIDIKNIVNNLEYSSYNYLKVRTAQQRQPFNSLHADGALVMLITEQ